MFKVLFTHKKVPRGFGITKKKLMQYKMQIRDAFLSALILRFLLCTFPQNTVQISFFFLVSFVFSSFNYQFSSISSSRKLERPATEYSLFGITAFVFCLNTTIFGITSITVTTPSLPPNMPHRVRLTTITISNFCLGICGQTIVVVNKFHDGRSL